MDSAQVKALREKLGWSQEKLAFKIGVKLSTVYAWEAGKSTPQGTALKDLKRLAKQAR